MNRKYGLDGDFRNDRFEEMWERFDTDGVGGLGLTDLWRLLAKDRVAADPLGGLSLSWSGE
jgi:hypothetical protein